MASAIIHLAVAKKVKEKFLVENEKDYFLGAIAPDIAKQIGRSKDESHFLINTREDVPNIEIFIKRYPYFKYNSFDLGYFTHLYTDKLWFENFMPTLSVNNSIKLLDGTIIQASEEEMRNMIYSDYTNLNIGIIEKYDLDLSLFYEEFVVPKTSIKEIPVENLDILINKMGILIENSKQEKTYTLDLTSIENFINDTADRILELLKRY
jgi:hypothetical protein